MTPITVSHCSSVSSQSLPQPSTPALATTMSSRRTARHHRPPAAATRRRREYPPRGRAPCGLRLPPTPGTSSNASSSRPWGGGADPGRDIAVGGQQRARPRARLRTPAHRGLGVAALTRVAISRSVASSAPPARDQRAKRLLFTGDCITARRPPSGAWRSRRRSRLATSGPNGCCSPAIASPRAGRRVGPGGRGAGALRREQLRHQSAPRFLPARVRPDSTGPSRRTRHCASAARAGAAPVPGNTDATALITGAASAQPAGPMRVSSLSRPGCTSLPIVGQLG